VENPSPDSVVRPGSLFRLWRQLWHRLLRLETPRQALAPWRWADGLAILVMAALVALLSSWPSLAEPSLRPGIASPFTVRAPKEATVVDTSALDQRRSLLGSRTHVQVSDPRVDHELEQQLEAQLKEVGRLAANPQAGVGAVSLTPPERQWLASLPAPDLKQWQQQLRSAQRRMLRQGLVASVARSQLEEAAAMQLESLPPPGRQLGARLVAESLLGRHNLRLDPTLSKRLIEDLLTQQGLPTISVGRGELIVRQGQLISPQSYDVLDYFGLVNRRPLPLVWLAHFSEALVTCAVIVLVSRRWRATLEPRQALLALAVLVGVQGFKLWLGPAVSPLALLVPPTLLLAQGLGTASGLAWLAGAALLWPMPLNGGLDGRMMVAAAVAAAAAVLAGRQRSRAQLLQLALLLPLGALALQWLLLQLGSLLGRESPLPLPADLAGEALLVMGLLMVGLLLSPLVESAFDLLTRARLLELADLERPLLRRLSCEAPGTFEHTLMICGLAEEGARAIHADVDLIRTGALYHDVGKLHGPQWFIENQGDGANPHDELDDPEASAAILQAHVDEGLRLARRYRLPRPLADFIPEHQGTLKMGYFLHQARERNPEIPEQRFRYRGPNPRSRETALLMLADGCEAALRSLPPNTSETEARAMVRRLIDGRWRDGQLAESGLGLAELELVVRSFVQVWRRMRHRRIPYPIAPRRGYSA